jgi:SAM-dependent methyltransferase
MKTLSDWFFVIVIWFILFSIIIIYRKINNDDSDLEGFEQKSPYTLKTENEIFDKFYMEIYEELHESSVIVEKQIQMLERMTQSTPHASRWLVIGSKSGIMLHFLLKKHYKAFGVDASEKAVEYSQQKYPSISVKCGNAEQNKLLFENGIFSHVLLLNAHIYDFKNKRELLRHVYGWLKPGGCLVLSLLAAGDKPHEQDFVGFRYQSAVTKNSFREKFTDKLSGHIRENERKVFAESDDQILTVVKEVGFSTMGKMLFVNLQQQEETIYFLLR